MSAPSDPNGNENQLTAPGKQNDTPAVSDSVESTRQEELLPCPFCGSQPKVSWNWVKGSFVECTNKNCAASSGCWTPEKLAIQSWNKRSSAPEQEQQTSGEKRETAATREGQDELLAIVSAVAEDNCIYGHEKCNSSDCFPCRAKRLLSEHATDSDDGSGFPQSQEGRCATVLGKIMAGGPEGWDAKLWGEMSRAIQAPSDRNARQAELARLEEAENALRLICINHLNFDPSDGEGTTPQEVVEMLASKFPGNARQATERDTDHLGEFAPKLLDAKWLDPECWYGCQSLKFKRDTARLDWLETAAWHHPDAGNGIAIFPFTNSNDRRTGVSLQGMGDQDGSDLGEEISHSYNSLREAIDAAMGSDASGAK